MIRWRLIRRTASVGPILALWLPVICALAACTSGATKATDRPAASPTLVAPTQTATPRNSPTSVPTRAPTIVAATATRAASPTPASIPASPEPSASPMTASRSPAPPSAVTHSPVARPPIIYETSVTLSTYGYVQALQPTQPDDPVFPYPRLDFDRVAEPAPLSYAAIVLENDYTSITVLPQLGGRILRWIDKATGENLFYANPVVKPTRWGYRGWWLATGGMEWALPVEEHGLNEWRPWAYRIQRSADSVTVHVSDTEDRTGLYIEVAITLDAQHSYFTVKPLIHNPTGAAQTYQFWLNAMLSLGGNSVSANTQFILPTSQVTIHSTGDSTLPGAYQPASWPVIGGRDMSRYGNWTSWLGVFDSPAAHGGFMGAYDHDSDLGVVRVYPVGVARGAKIFASGGLDPGLWTDDGSGYFELWGGLLPTFADVTSLAPGDSVGWTERWYAVLGIGGYDFANDHGAVRISETSEQIAIGIACTRRVTGTLVVWQAGQVIARVPVVVSPDRPLIHTVGSSPTGGAPGMQLIDDRGEVLLQYGSVGG